MTAEQAKMVIEAVRGIAVITVVLIVGVQIKNILEQAQEIRERGGSLLSLGIVAVESLLKAMLLIGIVASLERGYIDYVKSKVHLNETRYELPHSPD